MGVNAYELISQHNDNIAYRLDDVYMNYKHWFEVKGYGKTFFSSNFIHIIVTFTSQSKQYKYI